MWLLAVGVMLAELSPLALPQEVKPSPKLEECVADLNLWSSEITGYPNPSVDQIHDSLKSQTLKEIDGRSLSIGACAQAYPELQKAEAGRLSAAQSLLEMYGHERTKMLLDFLVRHNLVNKFHEEDAAGQR